MRWRDLQSLRLRVQMWRQRMKTYYNLRWDNNKWYIVIVTLSVPFRSRRPRHCSRRITLRLGWPMMKLHIYLQSNLWIFWIHKLSEVLQQTIRKATCVCCHLFYITWLNILCYYMILWCWLPFATSNEHAVKKYASWCVLWILLGNLFDKTLLSLPAICKPF
jgi:hypothetical protein